MIETHPTTHERLISARREIFNLNAGINPDLFTTGSINNHNNLEAQKISHHTKLTEFCITWNNKMKDAAKSVVANSPIMVKQADYDWKPAKIIKPTHTNPLGQTLDEIFLWETPHPTSKL